MREQQGGPRRRQAGILALVVAVALISLSVRAPISGIPPILDDLRAALGLSGTQTALLTMLPLLCMGLFAPVAPWLRTWLGEERTLGAALAVLVAALWVRAVWPQTALFAGTIVACSSIAFLNVLLPSLIKRRFPGGAAGVMLGVYTMGLGVGPAVAAGGTVPIYEASGGDVNVALGVWAVPAVVGLLAWLPQIGHGPQRASAGAGGGGGGRAIVLRRSALAWQVTLFMGLQSVSFFTTTSWLPTLYRDRGLDPTDAGYLLGLANLVSLVPALAAAPLASRMRDQRAAVAVFVALTVTGMLGTLLAPVGAAAAFAVLLGLGQGGNIGLALLLFVLRAPDSATTARLSGMAQSVGYTLASAGPFLVGALYSATGGWNVPFALLFAAAGAQLAFGLLAGRDRVVGPAEPRPRPADQPTAAR